LALHQGNFSSTLRSVRTLPTAGWAGPRHVWTWWEKISLSMTGNESRSYSP